MKQVSQKLFSRFSTAQQGNISYIRILNKLEKDTQQQQDNLQSEYLRSEHLSNLNTKKRESNLDIDQLVGASSRRSYFKHYSKSEPKFGYMRDFQNNKGLGLKPDGRWSSKDFEKKLHELYPEIARQYHIYLRNDANFTVFENQEKLREILEAKFQQENSDPSVSFDFDQELDKMLSVKDRVFEKDYLKKSTRKNKH